MKSLPIIFKNCAKSITKFVDKHSTEILVGCGIAGFVSTVVLVAKEAPIAEAKLDELHADLAERDEELSKTQIIFEEIKTVAPVYAPAIVTGAVSIGCVLGSYKIATGKTAAMATAYEITQAKYLDYQEKVKEEIGENKEKQIRDKVAQDAVNANPPGPSVLNGVLGDGLQWFYDPRTNQYFRSSVDDIRKAEKEVQHMLDSGYSDFMSVNEFLYEIGARDLNISIPEGDDWGFWSDRNGIDISFSSTVAPGPISALVLSYNDYSKHYTDHIYA